MSIIDALVQIPTVVIYALKRTLASVTDSSTPLLPFVPKSIKLFVLILLILQSPSFPFAWHLRVWKLPLIAYYNVWTKGPKKYLQNFEKSSQKTGGIATVSKLKRIAFFDDCDYNLHLSNSAYAKNLDASRMQWCMEAMAPAWTLMNLALGGSHYVFIKEIPILSEYTIETRIVGWGEKWLYLASEYIIYPKKKSGGKGKGKGKEEPITAIPSRVVESQTIIPSISTSASGSNTPDNMEDAKTVANIRSRAPRDDGGVVCAVAITEYCFKLGRQTIPPRIAMHYSMVSQDQAKRDHALNLIVGTKDKGRKWLKSGWKDEDNADLIGMEIGKTPGSGEEEHQVASWVEKTMKGMDKMTEGISVL